MEYLMTYGWALLAIVLVLVIIWWLLPQFIKAPESCLFSTSGFSCQELKPVIVSGEDGTVGVTFRLDNLQGQQIIVHNILCTTSPPADIRLEMTGVQDAESNVPSGGSHIYGSPERVLCYTADGQPVSLAPNSEFRGNIAVWYSFTEEVPGAPLRKATATLTGPVLAETS